MRGGGASPRSREEAELPCVWWARWVWVLRLSACGGFLRTGMDQRRAAAGSLRCRARGLVEDSRTTNSGVENRLVGQLANQYEASIVSLVGRAQVFVRTLLDN